MFTDRIKRIHKNQEGITGLETAIILIAFVVVAAVFAYTVLSAGLFASQKSSESVYSSLERTRSTVKLVGDIILIDTDSNDSVDQIKYNVGNSLGGEAVNFTLPPNNVVVISYSDKDQKVSNLTWSKTQLGNADTDDLLEASEVFEITISGLEAALNPDLGANTSFAIEMHDGGATLIMERTTPGAIDDVMNVH